MFIIFTFYFSVFRWISFQFVLCDDAHMIIASRISLMACYRAVAHTAVLHSSDTITMGPAVPIGAYRHASAGRERRRWWQ